MTHDEFWTLIADSLKASQGDPDAQLEAMMTSLSALSPEEIVAYDGIYGEYHQKAYRWDLWAAGYILQGGCSDDGFMDFRAWLISRGRETYDAVLADPEWLADFEFEDDPEESTFEEFGYLAMQAYEAKTGNDLPDRDIDFPSEPAGERWSEEGDDLQQRFPKLCAAVDW